jgi:DNA helicase HerA-like ATPase
MHSLICGVTESGKTTLAHSLAAMLSEAGQNVIVFDPVGTRTASGTWPKNAILFDDEQEFFAYLARADVFNSHVFVDEAGELFNSSKRENLWLLTRGRHFGFSVWMIAQRPKMIMPTARNQCSVAYIFRLAQDDLKEIGADFGHSQLQREILDKGDFLMIRSGLARFDRANVFDLLTR